VRVRFFDRLFPLTDPPQYEPRPEESIAAQAATRGVTPEALAYDLLLEQDGRAMLYLTISNYADASLEPVLAMLRHKDVVLGLGDGGAHMGMICDSSYPTTMLTHWVRDRSRGEKLPLPWVVKSLSADTAGAVGLHDRGRLAPGYRADVNVIDLDRLRLQAPAIVRDLPGGGRRLMQRAEGFAATIVAGQITYRNGEPTGALPGRLVRGRRQNPIQPS
jgi:N-acyl-D-aspartate/D-glutamate deacylase